MHNNNHYIPQWRSGRVFTNGGEDSGSILGQVIPKTQKMEVDASLLNTQHYKVLIKDKWSSPGKGVAPSTVFQWSSFWKGAFRLPSTMVSQFIYLCYNSSMNGGNLYLDQHNNIFIFQYFWYLSFLLCTWWLFTHKTSNFGMSAYMCLYIYIYINSSSLKLVEKFTYLGSSVSSTETDINTWLAKAWTAIDRLLVIWRPDW